MNQNALNLQSTRTRVFFWVGMLILPVFWIWWMRERYFSKTQRIIGWTWTALYVGAGVYWHVYVADGTEGLFISFDFVAILVMFELLLLLLLRIRIHKLTIIEFVVMLTVFLPPIAHFCTDATLRGIWIFSAILVVAHLVVHLCLYLIRMDFSRRMIQWIKTH